MKRVLRLGILRVAKVARAAHPLVGCQGRASAGHPQKIRRPVATLGRRKPAGHPTRRPWSSIRRAVPSLPLRREGRNFDFWLRFGASQPASSPSSPVFVWRGGGKMVAASWQNDAPGFMAHCANASGKSPSASLQHTWIRSNLAVSWANHFVPTNFPVARLPPERPYWGLLSNYSRLYFQNHVDNNKGV